DLISAEELTDELTANDDVLRHADPTTSSEYRSARFAELHWARGSLYRKRACYMRSATSG
ncbi:hypothetical protein, partial [Salmonella enterica]|uniref:hypothetical protein n=1 Tax=Salmonella enterica TaxID=28901 RepID=UPI001C37B1C6